MGISSVKNFLGAETPLLNTTDEPERHLHMTIYMISEERWMDTIYGDELIVDVLPEEDYFLTEEEAQKRCDLRNRSIREKYDAYVESYSPSLGGNVRTFIEFIADNRGTHYLVHEIEKHGLS